MRLRITFILLLLVVFSASAQHVPTVVTVAQYEQQIKTQPSRKLIDIGKVIPTIRLDVRYAAANNFMHKVMYSRARAYTRAPVIQALRLVMADLQKQGLGLKIYDAYRPYAVTQAFYQQAPNKGFVADPQWGSKHNRGCALDLTLVDLKTGKELPMPTSFDSFSRKAAAEYAGPLPADALKNRELLKAAMQAHGFKVLSTEWWHYDFTGWRNYELLDVPLERLN